MNSQQKQSQPFIPLRQEEKVMDTKAILLKQMKLLSPEEYHFFSFLIATTQLFEQLSNYQNKLTNDPSFSIWKLFEYFDINGDRKLQLNDLILTLQNLDIILKQEEIESLFKSLGGEDDNIISYAEFIVLFKSNNAPSFKQSTIKQDFVLTQEHQSLVQKIFNIYAKIEKGFIYLREQIGNNLHLIEELFRKMDIQQKGYLNLIDFTQYFKQKGIQFKNNELSRVFFLIQKHKSGRVNYDEFLEKFASQKTFNNYKLQLQELLKPPEQPKLQIIEQTQQNNFEQQSEINHKPILNDYLSKYSLRSGRSLNESDDSIRLPGFVRYDLQNNQY